MWTSYCKSCLVWYGWVFWCVCLFGFLVGWLLFACCLLLIIFLTCDIVQTMQIIPKKESGRKDNHNFLRSPHYVCVQVQQQAPKFLGLKRITDCNRHSKATFSFMVFYISPITSQPYFSNCSPYLSPVPYKPLAQGKLSLRIIRLQSVSYL